MPSLILVLSLDAQSQPGDSEEAPGPHVALATPLQLPRHPGLCGETQALPTAPSSEWLEAGWQGRLRIPCWPELLICLCLAGARKVCPRCPVLKWQLLIGYAPPGHPSPQSPLQAGKHGNKNQPPCYLGSAAETLTKDHLSPTALGGLPLSPPWQTPPRCLPDLMPHAWNIHIQTIRHAPSRWMSDHSCRTQSALCALSLDMAFCLAVVLSQM